MQQPVGEAGRRFQRVAEGVAEIEQHALAGFALVSGNDSRLAAAADGDGVLARRVAAGEQVLPVRLQPGKKRGVAEQPVFGDLRVAGTELALRQRVEQRGVGDDQDRLVEGADRDSCPARELMPVLPPTDELTCASRVVGTCTKSTPRRTQAAAKPARSPITPPPSARTRSPRSMRAATIASHTVWKLGIVLGALARRYLDRRAADAGGFERGFAQRRDAARPPSRR